MVKEKSSFCDFSVEKSPSPSNGCLFLPGVDKLHTDFHPTTFIGKRCTDVSTLSDSCPKPIEPLFQGLRRYLLSPFRTVPCEGGGWRYLRLTVRPTVERGREGVTGTVRAFLPSVPTGTDRKVCRNINVVDKKLNGDWKTRRVNTRTLVHTYTHATYTEENRNELRE